MNVYTATFSNGSSHSANSKTRVYTHAFMVGGGYVGFASSKEKAISGAKSIKSALRRPDDSVEIVETEAK